MSDEPLVLFLEAKTEVETEWFCKNENIPMYYKPFLSCSQIFSDRCSTSKIEIDLFRILFKSIEICQIHEELRFNLDDSCTFLVFEDLLP